MPHVSLLHPLILGIPRVTIEPTKKKGLIAGTQINLPIWSLIIVYTCYPRLKSICFCKGRWFRWLLWLLVFKLLLLLMAFKSCTNSEVLYACEIIFQGLHSHPFEGDSLIRNFHHHQESQCFRLAFWARWLEWCFTKLNFLNSRTYQNSRNSIEPRLFPFANFFRNFPGKLPKNSCRTTFGRFFFQEMEFSSKKHSSDSVIFAVGL